MHGEIATIFSQVVLDQFFLIDSNIIKFKNQEIFHFGYFI